MCKYITGASAGQVGCTFNYQGESRNFSMHFLPTELPTKSVGWFLYRTITSND